MYLEQELAEKLFNLIEAYETIIIHRHKRPDPDAIGSQLGFKNIITHNFPYKRVLVAGSTTKGLSWLGEMDSVSVADYQNALVIITDTANTERIDGEHYDKGEFIVKIDHHPAVEPYGQLQIVYPIASSTSEIIVSLTQLLANKLTLNLKAAELLYAGIVGDTGRFLFNSTTAHTFEMTSVLLQQGIDAFRINDRFQIMTQAEMKLQAFGYENLVVNEHGVAYLIITKEDMQHYQVSEEQTNLLVNLASRIEGVYVWVTFVEQDSAECYYRCRIRSKGPQINEIATLHGGGGHPMASGANAYSQAEIATIIDELSQASFQYQQSLLD